MGHCGFVEGVVLMPFVQKIVETLCKDFKCMRCDLFFDVMLGICKEAVRQSLLRSPCQRASFKLVGRFRCLS
jgi:hypothetical protein